jgi:hypothetical protein
MIVTSVVLMMQAVAGGIVQPAVPQHVPAKADSTAAERATVERLRTDESEFMMTWRNVWEQTFNGIRPIQARLTAAHCHADGSYQGGAPHAIHPDSSPNLKAWCPIFYNDTMTLRGDARRGIDYMLPLYAENLLRKQRALLVLEFDSATTLFPANLWMTGQRVRLDVDQRMYADAITAAHDCRGNTSWCSMLTGYALAQAGDLGPADSMFARGLRAMQSLSDLCQWTDISTLLPQPERGTYGRLTCAERATINERFWWLANPLMSEPGNERRVEEYSRKVIVALHSALTADEFIDWRPEYGRVTATELLLRYGLPSYAAWPDSMENAEHFTWMGFRDSSVNTDAEYMAPRFHTAPPWHAIADPMTLTREDWNGLAPARTGTTWAWGPWKWPTEFYGRDAGSLVELDDQTAVLRRDTSALVVVATQMPAAFIPEAEATPYVGTLVFSLNARDTTHFPHRTVDVAKTVVLTGHTSIPTIVSAELMPAGGATGPAGRSRFAFTPPPPLAQLKPGEVALSDIVLFKPPTSDDSMPVSAVGALPRMFGSTKFHDSTKVGIYWEVYGLTATDTVDVGIRVIPVEASTLGRRLAGLVGLGHDEGSIQIRWREPQVSRGGLTSYEGRVPVQPHAIRFDLSPLKPGQYVAEVSVTQHGRPPIVTRRSITIQ